MSGVVFFFWEGGVILYPGNSHGSGAYTQVGISGIERTQIAGK